MPRVQGDQGIPLDSGGLGLAPVIPLRQSEELAGLVEAWLSEYTIPCTITSYRKTVLRAVRQLGARHPLDLTGPEAIAWITRSGANNTVRARVTAVRAFLRWAATNGHAEPHDDAPFRRIMRGHPRTYGKVQAKHPARFLTKSEAFGDLTATCDDTDTGMRDELAIRLGLLGMRVGEIRTLTFRALASSPQLHWTGKGNKPRRATAGAALLDLLARYQARYEAVIGRPVAPEDPIICVSRKGRPYTQLRWGTPYTDAQGIEGIVKRRATQAALGHVAPHDLRRTAASVLHNARTDRGAHHFDLLDIQQVLGHSDPAVTMRCYLEPMNTDLIDRAATFLD